MILLVDDKLPSSADWIGLIEEALGQTVRRTSDVRTAEREARQQSEKFNALEDRSGMFSMAILDVMMKAPGREVGTSTSGRQDSAADDWVQNSGGGAVTGVELARRLRRLKGFEKLPIIFLTAHSDESVIWDLKHFDQPSAYFNKGSMQGEDFLEQIEVFLNL